MRSWSILWVALTLAVLPAQALGTSRDVTATHAYIDANYKLARASVRNIAPGQAKIERFNSGLAHECPHLGLGSPENEASQPISHEVAVALWSLAYGADAGPIRRFAQAVRRLHWSNRTITSAAQRYASSLQEMATLPLPHLCEDVRAWKASGFRAIPRALVSFVERVDAIELKAIPRRLLAPYERDGDARLLTLTEHLERRIEEQEFIVGQRDWVQVLDTLGLNE